MAKPKAKVVKKKATKPEAAAGSSASPVPAPSAPESPAKVPQHQWTHDGGKVLIAKCLNVDGTGHDGFAWPVKGKTICPKAQADREAANNGSCESGGLFGWAWGVNLGGGKDPDYRAPWLVFAADPADVIDCDGKCKAIGEVKVLYYGTWAGALEFTRAGRL